MIRRRIRRRIVQTRRTRRRSLDRALRSSHWTSRGTRSCLLTLVNERQIDRTNRLVIQTDVEIIVLHVARSSTHPEVRRFQPVVTAEDSELRIEGERAERRPTMALVIRGVRRWERLRTRGDIVPVLGPEILNPRPNLVICVRCKQIEALCSIVDVDRI